MEKELEDEFIRELAKSNYGVEKKVDLIARIVKAALQKRPTRTPIPRATRTPVK